MDAMRINTSTTQASVNTARESLRANTNTDSVSRQGVNSTQDQSRTARETEAANRENNTSNRELANVVSRSQDGDTVQVKPSTQEVANRAGEGNVVARERSAAAKQIEEARKRQEEIRARQEELRMQQQERAANNERARNQASDRADSISQTQNNRDTLNRVDERNIQNRLDNRNARDEASQVNSFAGYTTSQLETLYRQGRISRQDYERQIQAREDRTENTTNNNSATSREMARLNGTISRAQMNQAAITGAYSDNANANAAASATQRVEAMQRVQDIASNQQTAAVNEGRRQWAYQLQA